MNEPTLFDAPAGLARASDPVTSVDAARSITGRAEREVLDLFEATHRGYTDDELCAALPNRFGPTLKSARSRLTNHHLLVDGGSTRPSTRGRDSIVWVLP